MNKKELILVEAKRLSGQYGYLGFTLKQLAQACEMTAPALYYFYTSKAELFKDCLVSELEKRHQSISEYTRDAHTLAEFVDLLATDSFEKCGATSFRTGQAMEEIIHLPAEIRTELRQAWDTLLIAPVEAFLDRIYAGGDLPLPSYLMATFLINMATFVAAQDSRYDRETLTGMMIAAAQGIEAGRPDTLPR